MRDDISYFSIEGRHHQDYINKAGKALLYSQAKFPSKNLVLFAPGPIVARHPNTPVKSENLDLINFIKIPQLNLRDHSSWFIHEIAKYLETDYLITVESDGFVINPESWKDEFLQYDFIGAPWPNSFGNINRVGNGGFALWSKKFLMLLGTLEDKEIPYGPVYMYDYLICVYMYKMLLERGVKFAPVEVAIKFSIENEIEGFPPHRELKPFGFHGKRSSITEKYMRLI